MLKYNGWKLEVLHKRKENRIQNREKSTNSV